jgi:predicted nucleic acid-binding Zn ribbon protein
MRRRRSAKRRGTPDRLGAFLVPSIEGTALHTLYRRHLVVEAWPEIAGELGAHCRATSLGNGILTVSTTTNLWAVEISYRKEQLLRRLRERFPDIEIKGIRLVVRRLEDEPCEPLDDGSGEDEVSGFLEDLSPQDDLTIERECACVDDPALREKVRRAMAADLRYRRARERMGWKPCPGCGIPTADGLSCLYCAREASEERLRAIEKLLAATPWLAWEDVHDSAPRVSRNEYEKIRADMAAHLSRKLQEIYDRSPKDQPLKRDERAICMAYCMMKSGEPLHELREETLQRYLGDGLFSLYCMHKEVQ